MLTTLLCALEITALTRAEDPGIFVCRWGVITRAAGSDFRQDSKLYRDANIPDVGNRLNTELSYELFATIAYGIALDCRHAKSLAKIS